MKRIRYILLCACALIGTCAQAYAQAPGAACRTAIPMGKDYNAQVRNGQTVWYSAWTFDLPLTVTFAPESKTDPAPEVEMDFTCTPDYYQDSILCSLFCKTSNVQFDMPHKPSLSSKTLEDGTFVYYLSLGKRYRDLLLQVGISYNVEVFVKVTYKCNGKISLAPDDLFTNCVDNAKFMHFGDTVDVKASDKQRHVIVPYVQWQEDTIIYRWKGTAPLTMSVANTCDFDPTDNTDGNIIQYVANIQPGDSVKVSATRIYNWVHNPRFPNEAGMYFAKFYSAEPGTITVVKAPQSPPQGEATLLRFDKTYPLNASDSSVFAITRIWNDDTLNTQFVAPTEHVFRMTIATDPDFAAEHVLKEYQFEKKSSGRWLGVYGKEMVAFWGKTTEQYLYIRFDCSEATTITPSKWQVSSCVVNTKNYITSLDTSFTVKRASTGGNYILNYSQWLGGDLKMTFTPAQKCSVFVATDCSIKTTAAPAPNRLYYKLLTQSKNSLTIPADTIASWAPRVAEDGYIYMCLYHSSSGTYKMAIKSSAPEDTDPVYPASTIAVACDGTKVVVMVSQPQTIEVYDESSVKKAEWNAEPGTPHELVLPVGKYTLVGEKEKIEINL